LKLSGSNQRILISEVAVEDYHYRLHRLKRNTTMHTMRKTSSVIAAVSLGVLFAAPASARIECKEDYQLVAGSLIATPYCQDENLASVARRYYGMKVSGAAVRNNPNYKLEVCRLIGRDNRVRGACVSSDPFPRGRL
jgi:hypothetical protein